MDYILRKATKPFRRLSDVINKFPLSGKFLIRPAMFWVYTAPPESGFTRISLVLLLMGFMILMHGIQLWLGWKLYTMSSFVFVQTIGISYAVVNALVVYTQSILSLRLIGTTLRHYQRNSYKRYPPTSYKPAYALLCLAITVGGQAVFVITFSLTYILV